MLTTTNGSYVRLALSSSDPSDGSLAPARSRPVAPQSWRRCWASRRKPRFFISSWQFSASWRTDDGWGYPPDRVWDGRRLLLKHIVITPVWWHQFSERLGNWQASTLRRKWPSWRLLLRSFLASMHSHNVWMAWTFKFLVLCFLSRAFVFSGTTLTQQSGTGSHVGMGLLDLPSGKRLHNYGKSQSLIGKSTINGYFQ